jgi:hypothetical protein
VDLVVLFIYWASIDPLPVKSTGKVWYLKYYYVISIPSSDTKYTYNIHKRKTNHQKNEPKQLHQEQTKSHPKTATHATQTSA